MNLFAIWNAISRTPHHIACIGRFTGCVCVLCMCVPVSAHCASLADSKTRRVSPVGQYWHWLCHFIATTQLRPCSVIVPFRSWACVCVPNARSCRAIIQFIRTKQNSQPKRATQFRNALNGYAHEATSHVCLCVCVCRLCSRIIAICDRLPLHLCTLQIGCDS